METPPAKSSTTRNAIIAVVAAVVFQPVPLVTLGGVAVTGAAGVALNNCLSTEDVTADDDDSSDPSDPGEEEG